jgi:hypothetical protein
MTWHEISGADHYVVSRRTTGSYSVIGTPSTASFSDTSVSASTTYVYKVVARNSSNDEISSYSYPDIATTVSFTDPDLEAGVTVMKAVHITELRNAVDLARTAAGLGGASWSGSLTSGSTVISAAHIAELRTNLNAALAALGASLWTYTDPTLTAAATRIKRVHINELRERVK